PRPGEPRGCAGKQGPGDGASIHPAAGVDHRLDGAAGFSGCGLGSTAALGASGVFGASTWGGFGASGSDATSGSVAAGSFAAGSSTAPSAGIGGIGSARSYSDCSTGLALAAGLAVITTTVLTPSRRLRLAIASLEPSLPPLSNAARASSSRSRCSYAVPRLFHM